MTRLSSHPSQTDVCSLHFDIFLITSCIDRMDGVATNAVIAVPDDKYGEVSRPWLLTILGLARRLRGHQGFRVAAKKAWLRAVAHAIGMSAHESI